MSSTSPFDGFRRALHGTEDDVSENDQRPARASSSTSSSTTSSGKGSGSSKQQATESPSAASSAGGGPSTSSSSASYGSSASNISSSGFAPGVRRQKPRPSFMRATKSSQSKRLEAEAAGYSVRRPSSSASSSSLIASKTSGNGGRHGHGTTKDSSEGHAGVHGSSPGKKRKRKKRSNARQRSTTSSSSSSSSTIKLPARPLVSINSARNSAKVLVQAVELLGWTETLAKREQELCSLLWHEASIDEEVYAELEAHQMVNKFPYFWHVAKKGMCAQLLKRMQLLFPTEYDFFPRTWVVPYELDDFEEYCADKPRRKATYIVKPDGGSQGEGIYLIKRFRDLHLSSINPNLDMVVQRYLDSPYLLDGYKFDLRLYVLLLGVDPLRVVICKEGLARFCTEPYEAPSNSNMGESYMHLTNYSLNKYNSSKFVHNDGDDTGGQDGSKRRISSVFARMRDEGIDVDAIWKRIQDLVVFSMIAYQPTLANLYNSAFIKAKSNHTNHCFQILGFDIILDKKLNPWLLEINSNPSLNIDFDHEIGLGIYEKVPSAIDRAVKLPAVLGALARLKFGPPTHEDEADNNSSSSSSSNSTNSNTGSSDMDRHIDGQSSSDVVVDLFAAETLSTSATSSSSSSSTTSQASTAEEEEEEANNKEETTTSTSNSVSSSASTSTTRSKRRKRTGTKSTRGKPSKETAMYIDTGDGHLIDMEDDFIDAYPGEDPEQYDTLMVFSRALRVFEKYAMTKNKLEMTGSKFYRLCRDARLIGNTLSAPDCDLIFQGVVKASNARTMMFHDFCEALMILAARKYTSGELTMAEKMVLLVDLLDQLA